MKGSLKTQLTRVAKGQGGFALIEMIMGEGIIAVLATVIIPKLALFLLRRNQRATFRAGAVEVEIGRPCL